MAGSDPHGLFASLHIGVKRVVPILGKGTINEVYRVEKEDGHTVILRMNKDREAEESMHEYHREAWCMRMAALAGVPTPESLGYGIWEDRGWSLQTFVPGPTSDEVPESNATAWRFLGECLRKLEAFAWVDHEQEAREVFGPPPPAFHWEGQLSYNLTSLTSEDPLLKLGVYPLDQQEEIRRAFASLEDPDLRFGLAHGDFARRNVILSPWGPVLIDWGCATQGQLPAYEIVETLRNAVDGDPNEEGFRAFEAGYGGFGPLRPRLPALRLLRAFDLVRWAIDRRPERIEELAGNARKTFEKLSLWPED